MPGEGGGGFALGAHASGPPTSGTEFHLNNNKNYTRCNYFPF